MTGSTSRRVRTRWIAVLVALLTFAGTGVAAAYWTAEAQVDDTASTAAVGLEQELVHEGESSLSTTYTADNLTAAGLVSVANTGTREAGYTLTVSAVSDSDLAEAIQVVLAPVGLPEQCTPQATLENAKLGSVSDPLTGSLDKEGGKALVCVQTSLAGDKIVEFAEQAIALEVSSALVYAEEAKEAEWTPIVAEIVTQSVADERPICAREPQTYLRFALPSPPEGQAGSVEYRVFFAHKDTPDNRESIVLDNLSGYHPVIDLEYTMLEPFVESPNGGIGDTWVYAEQKLDDEQTWTAIASFQIHTFHSGTEQHDQLRMYCGWQ